MPARTQYSSFHESWRLFTFENHCYFLVYAVQLEPIISIMHNFQFIRDINQIQLYGAETRFKCLRYNAVFRSVIHCVLTYLKCMASLV